MKMCSGISALLIGFATACGAASQAHARPVVVPHHVDDAPVAQAVRADGIAGLRVGVKAAEGIESEPAREGKFFAEMQQPKNNP